jgi:hypothetical protein
MDSNDANEAIREGEPPIDPRTGGDGELPIISRSEFTSLDSSLPLKPQSPGLDWLWLVIVLMMVIQFFIAMNLLFDRPRPLSDLGKEIVLGIIYASLLFIGSVCALVKLAWKTAALQFALVLAVVTWLSLR